MTTISKLALVIDTVVSKATEFEKTATVEPNVRDNIVNFDELKISTDTFITTQQIDPDRVIRSQKSMTSFHSTIFEDFRLSASAVYNFYTPDEHIASELDISSPVWLLPRYVELTWRVVPMKFIPLDHDKGVHRVDKRSPADAVMTDVNSAINAIVNGYISQGVVTALLVSPLQIEKGIEFTEDEFLIDPKSAGMDAAAVSLDGNSDYHRHPVPTTSTRTRITFLDPAIAGALTPTRINSSKDQLHLNTIGTFSTLVAGLEVISEFNQDVPPRNPPPQVIVPASTPTLMYIGYIIERYDLAHDGTMTLGRTFQIQDIEQRRFVDRSVAFGERYAYHIRAIVQWSRIPTLGFIGDSTLDRLEMFDPSGPPMKAASFYAGDWSDWARTEVLDNILPSPPDEITVRPISRKNLIDIVWKMPNDPQRDTAAVRLVRATVVAGKMSDWKELGEFVPANGRFVDRDVATFEESQVTYVYAMYSTSKHSEISVLSEQVAARLTNNSRRGEYQLEQFSPSGADPTSHPAGVPERVPTVVEARKNITFYCRGAKSNHPLFDRTYVVEVQSLSNGERVQVELSVDSTDVDVGKVRVV